MRGWLLVLLVACGTPEVQVPLGTDEPALRTWLDSPSDAGGVLVVQLQVDDDAAVDLPEPEVRGLSLEPAGEPRTEQVGEQLVTTRRYSYSGPKGMYEVPSLTASWEDLQGEVHEVSSAPLWIDLGVPPPRQGELVDITDPQPVARGLLDRPWWEYAAVAVVAVVTVLGFRMAFGRRKEPVQQPLPLHVRILREWEAVRDDPAVDEHDKALAISRLFREYVEQALGFEATAWTTSEILERMKALPHLPQGNLPRARRLLRATDRVKFAEAGTTAELFEELDADLRAVVRSTRPRAFQEAS